MAITKNVENEYGSEFKYHKIKEVRITNNPKEGIVLVMTVESYKDKKARINGKLPTVRTCSVFSADFAMSPFYSLLKAKFPEFSDSLDDFDNSFKPVIEKNPTFYEADRSGQVKEWQDQTEVKED